MIRLFRVLIPASVLTLFVLEALVIFACYTAIPYFQGDADLFLFYESGWQQIAIVEGLILFCMYFRHLYQDPRVLSRIFLAQQLSLVIGVMFICQALISYWDSEMALPRTILISGSALALLALLLLRILFSLMIGNKIGGRRLLFLGMSPTIVELIGHLRRHPEYGLVPVGYLDDRDTTHLPDPGVARLGPVAELPAVVYEYRPDRIVVGRQDEIQPQRLDDFIDLRFGGLHTEQAASLYETTLGRVCASEIRPAALLYSDSLQPNAFNLKLQSLYSKVVALAALAVTLPVVAVLAALVKAGSPGPWFIREWRIGLNGAPFLLYRFHWVPLVGEATRLQKTLCGYGLDAYPQFWNVLRGDMSIVGPSPDRPEFARRLNGAIPFHMQRTAVRPGMTGWAQIQIHDRGTGLTRDAMRRLEYDLYYVKNLSPSLDLSVMLRWFRDTVTFGALAAV